MKSGRANGWGGATKRVFAILIAVAGAPASAQPEVTHLQCDGKYSNFLTGYRDVQDKGGYVEVQKSSVRVVSVIGFEGTYAVRTANEARVFFVHSDDNLIRGSLNRFSGQLQLHQQSKKPRSGDFGGFDQMWEGTCTTARPMF